MTLNQWDPAEEPIRPGLYTNIEKAAEAVLLGGARGIVGVPLMKYGAKATEGEFYTVKSEDAAKEMFGIANIQTIKFVLSGGASEVLVYAMPELPEAEDYETMREAFEARPFDVFVYDGEVDETEQLATVAWVARNRKEKKHFTFVTGGTAAEDADSTLGDARTSLLADDYVVNLISGGVIGNNEYSSGVYAAYIAGLVGGTPINKSITYTVVALDDVTKRLRNVEIIESLKAGSLVLVHDGEKVKVEQGLTTSVDKIRKVRARQAIATDIEKLARDNYIGKIDNNPAGQATLISAIKLYLETLENENVLVAPTVELDGRYESKGDKAYLSISYGEQDSLERVFVTINI